MRVQPIAVLVAASHPVNVHLPSLQYGGLLYPQFGSEKVNKHGAAKRLIDWVPKYHSSERTSNMRE